MESNISETLCKERMRLLDERFARDKQRLEKIEERIGTVEHEQSDAGKALLKLTTMEEQDRERLDDHGRRLESLEHRPSMWWDKTLAAGISALVSGAIAVLSNAIF